MELMSKSNIRITVFVTIIVFSLLALGEAFADNPAMYTADSNNDGKPDQWYSMENDAVKYLEMDRNYDGKVDYIADYGEDGKLIKEELDFNYDGKMDDFYYYNEDGVLSREEIDSNFDGKPDIWIYLYKGIYIKKYEKDKNFDGRVDIVKDYSK